MMFMYLKSLFMNVGGWESVVFQIFEDLDYFYLLDVMINLKNILNFSFLFQFLRKGRDSFVIERKISFKYIILVILKCLRYVIFFCVC